MYLKVNIILGSGTSDIKDYLFTQAKPHKWLYEAKKWSDQTSEDIILASVKAKLLDFLPNEIPYQLKPIVEYFEVNNEGSFFIRTFSTNKFPH